MIISEEKKNEIKSAADIVEVVGESVDLRKNGKDYFGLCPFHDEKTPSFSVIPDKQIFYCFGCGATGDVFEFLVKKDGVSFPDAVTRVAERYGINIECSRSSAIPIGGPAASGNRQIKPKKEEFVPSVLQAPGEIWQEKAEKLVSWAHDNLLNNSKRLAWLEERGIGIELIKYSMLGWNPGENGKDLYRPRESWGLEPALKDDGTKKKLWIPVGLVIPMIERVEGLGFRGQEKPETRDQKPETFCVERIRIRTERDQPKYYVLPGSGMRCLVFGAHASRAYVIVESELDGIMIYGKVRANKIGAAALGSASKKPELETYDILKKAPVILNALDYDAAGKKAVEWWEERFPDSHRRWPVPEGKDPGDAYKAGIDIAAWIRAGLPEVWNWEAKDSRISAIKTGGPTAGFGGSSEKQKPETMNQKPGTGPSETFGRLDLLNDDVEGGAPEVSSLEEFVAIVKNSPQVTIHVSPEGLKVDELPAWSRAFPERSRRLSELVFMNKEVRSFLMGLGDVRLSWKDVEDRMKKKA